MAGSAAAVEGRFNPFPGLRPFEPDEDYLFFGRERQTDELLRKLRTTKFLSILGTSGSGKSSLVRSGLIPALHGGGMAAAGSSWRVAILRPGDDPIGNLAAALAAPEALGDNTDDERLTRAFYETTLRASHRGLVEVIEQARLPERANLLVLVDQFEEIFRFKRRRRVVGRDEAQAFVKLLLFAAQVGDLPCYVSLTMRSDFVGNCMEFGGLPEIINRGLYLVPRMSRDELRAAITGPVAVAGSTIAPRLVSRLLNDIGDNLDQLPILQHALMRTTDLWQADHAPGEAIDLRHFDKVGGMVEALSQHAEEAYAELTPARQRIAELLFKTLTDRGTDGRGVRRPAAVSEVCSVTGASVEEVTAVVDVFRQPGRSFLVPAAGIELDENSVLDISHESLMRVWTRLSEWVDREARSAQLYLSLARAAARHEAGTAALWRDPELQLALTWRVQVEPTREWAKRYDPGFDRAIAFLEASRQERDREVLEREELRRAKLRRAKILVLILLTASIVTLGLGALAYSQKNRAEEALTEAERQKEIAERARGLAEERREESERQRLAAERARETAERQTELASQAQATAEVERANALAKEREARDERTRAETARSLAEQREQEATDERKKADDARQVAQTSEAETRRLSRLAWARALALQIPQLDDAPELAALLALESYRLNRDHSGPVEDADLFTALRVALDRLRAPALLTAHDDAVRALAFGADGALVSGGEDGAVLRFDRAAAGAEAAPLGKALGPVRALAADPRSGRLAAGTRDGEILLWSASTSDSSPRSVATLNGQVGAVALQPGGGMLAFGGSGGIVRLLDPEASTIRELAAASADAMARDLVLDLAFGADGRRLVAAVGRGGARAWRLDRPGEAPAELCAGLDVRSVALAPGGELVACGGGRGRIEFAAAGATRESPPGPLLGHQSSVNSLAFDPRGDVLASASSDGTVRLWNLRRPGSQPAVLPGGRTWLWAVAFDPSGEILAAGGQDRAIRIWPARAERLAAEICATAERGLTAEEWERYLPTDLPFPGDRPCPGDARSPRP